VGNSFSYLWSTGQTEPIINNLAPGLYTVTVENNLNCSSQNQIQILEPDPLAVSFSTVEPDCNQDNGSVTISISGGTPSYNIQWSNDQTGPTLNQVGTGNYTVIVTDQNSCVLNAETTLAPLNTPQISLNHTNSLSCNGDSNGFIELTVSGGTPNYSFSWEPSVSTTNSATNLLAGAYSITVVDEAGCEQIIFVSINEPEAISAIVNISSPTCGFQNGSIQIEASGGVGTLKSTI
jgi:hypothetical protein